MAAGTPAAIGSVGVTKTASSLNYEATINVKYTVPSKNVNLTTWSGNDIKKGTVPPNVTDNSNVTLVDASLSDDTFAIEVLAYLTDTSTNKSEEGHDAAWAAGVKGLTENAASKTLTFSYDQDVDTGTLLLDTEVYFCAAKSTAAAAAYAKASEGVSGAEGKTQSFAINAKDLIDSNVGEANATRVGWLYVRIEGSVRQHDNTKDYTATIASALA